jgi:hypothetical protein
MSKARAVVTEINDSFGRQLDCAFQSKFDCKLDTTWDIFAMTHVTHRADCEPLTEQQRQFIATWTAGYHAAFGVAGAFLDDLNRRSTRNRKVPS